MRPVVKKIDFLHVTILSNAAIPVSRCCIHIAPHATMLTIGRYRHALCIADHLHYALRIQLYHSTTYGSYSRIDYGSDTSYYAHRAIDEFCIECEGSMFIDDDNPKRPHIDGEVLATYIVRCIIRDRRLTCAALLAFESGGYKFRRISNRYYRMTHSKTCVIQ